MVRLAFVVAGVFGVAAAAAATDSTVEWSFGVPQTMALGLGTGDGTMPALAGCAALSVQPNRDAVFYDKIVLTNTGPRRAELVVSTVPMGGAANAVCTEDMDTTMQLYRGTFNPADPRTNCVEWNNDIFGGNECSWSSPFDVAPGETITIVVAGAQNGDRYPYDLRFDGSVYSPSVFYASFEPTELYNGHGMATTGQFTVDGYPAPFAAGSMLNGGVDSSNGNIQGRLALSPVQLQDMATNLGFVTLRAQLWQDGVGTGQLTGGNAAYSASNLYLRLQHATVNGNPVDLGGNCQFGPISWALTGNADADAIDLMQNSFTIPPQSSPANCNGLGAQLSAVVSGNGNSATVSFER